ICHVHQTLIFTVEFHQILSDSNSSKLY
ncbi:uncharacterized protein METZ01_LOCUS512148, partial [marine metagenome]